MLQVANPNGNRTCHGAALQQGTGTSKVNGEGDIGQVQLNILQPGRRISGFLDNGSGSEPGTWFEMNDDGAVVCLNRVNHIGPDASHAPVPGLDIRQGNADSPLLQQQRPAHGESGWHKQQTGQQDHQRSPSVPSQWAIEDQLNTPLVTIR